MCWFSHIVCLNGSLKIDAFELDFDADLAVDDFDKLLDYNKHDIRATELFFDKCRSAVEIRHKLTEKTGINHLNWSDTTASKSNSNASILSMFILNSKSFRLVLRFGLS
jgi:uncharacterized protein with NAD-binding domain and iron-sulfur cluster